MTIPIAVTVLVTGLIALIAMAVLHASLRRRLDEAAIQRNTESTIAWMQVLWTDMTAVDDLAQLSRVDTILDNLRCDDPVRRREALHQAETLDSDWRMLTDTDTGMQ